MTAVEQPSLLPFKNCSRRNRIYSWFQTVLRETNFELRVLHVPRKAVLIVNRSTIAKRAHFARKLRLSDKAVTEEGPRNCDRIHYSLIHSQRVTSTLWWVLSAIFRLLSRRIIPVLQYCFINLFEGPSWAMLKIQLYFPGSLFRPSFRAALYVIAAVPHTS